MLYVGVLVAYVTVSVAQSTEEHLAAPQNVITVPPNCPPGQELVNGACREIWSALYNPNAANLGVIDPANFITVPANCPPGQVLINGACRDVWRFKNLELRNRRQSDTEVDILETSGQEEEDRNRNIINIPNQCPIGYRPDALGICRQIMI